MSYVPILMVDKKWMPFVYAVLVVFVAVGLVWLAAQALKDFVREVRRLRRLRLSRKDPNRA